jgi:hypothetical protein
MKKINTLSDLPIAIQNAYLTIDRIETGTKPFSLNINLSTPAFGGRYVSAQIVIKEQSDFNLFKFWDSATLSDYIDIFKNIQTSSYVEFTWH